jgi:hypothetical protein
MINVRERPKTKTGSARSLALTREQNTETFYNSGAIRLSLVISGLSGVRLV